MEYTVAYILLIEPRPFKLIRNGCQQRNLVICHALYVGVCGLIEVLLYNPKLVPVVYLLPKLGIELSPTSY